MVVELSWTITADDFREAHCCVCSGGFIRGVVEAHLVSESDRLHLGEVCPECIHRGARYIRERVRKNLRMSSMMQIAQARMEARASGEAVEECPSPEEYEEYEAFVVSVGGPRYASRGEADAAYERGGW